MRSVAGRKEQDKHDAYPTRTPRRGISTNDRNCSSGNGSDLTLTALPGGTFAGVVYGSGFSLHQHLESAAHGGVEELVDGVALGAELPGGALDDLLDVRFTGLEEEMRLVGEQHGFQTEPFAQFDGEVNSTCAVMSCSPICW